MKIFFATIPSCKSYELFLISMRHYLCYKYIEKNKLICADRILLPSKEDSDLVQPLHGAMSCRTVGFKDRNILSLDLTILQYITPCNSSR
jgi:hypothetical protein